MARSTVTYDELLALARRFADQPLTTVTGREFTVGVYRDSLIFTPVSSGLGQSDGRKAAERFLERYNATGSLRPGDYADVSRNASYLVGLIRAGSDRPKREVPPVAGITKKSFDTPDETRTPAKTRIEVVRLGGQSAARFTFQPGWRWSEAIRPVAGTDSCQVRHVGAVVSGTLHVEHTDGSAGEARPGDAYVIEPGHDAWVVGDEPVVLYEFESADTYAKG